MKKLVFLLIFSAFFVSCAKNNISSAPVIEYGEVCNDANNEKEVSVQGFLNVAEKVPCMNMFSSKRQCAFKFLDKVNIVGKEIFVYLPEGAEKNHAETPDTGKSNLKPTSVFTRDEVKFRLNDGNVITPQVDIATPVTVTGKVTLTDGGGGEKICSIMTTKIEKQQ